MPWSPKAYGTLSRNDLAVRMDDAIQRYRRDPERPIMVAEFLDWCGITQVDALEFEKTAQWARICEAIVSPGIDDPQTDAREDERPVEQAERRLQEFVVADGYGGLLKVGDTFTIAGTYADQRGRYAAENPRYGVPTYQPTRPKPALVPVLAGPRAYFDD